MRKNTNGYKIGYRDDDSKLFIRKFITHTHKQAHKMLLYYRKYGHGGVKKAEIKRFNYKIKPITQREILAGIWEENPFQDFNPFLSFSLGIF